MLNLVTRRTHTVISVIVIIALILPLWLQPTMIRAASLPASAVSNDPPFLGTLREKPLDSPHLMTNERISSPDGELARSPLGNMSQFEQTVADLAATSFVFDPMADILSVARVQSTYVPSGLISNTLVITFQVSNASLEDTLQNVVITDVLTAGVTVLEPPENVALDDDLLSIAVGDLPPAAFKSVTVTLDVGTFTPPINLDGGAHVIGILDNLTLHNWTAPARLVVMPPEGEDSLKSTVDANLLDEYVLQKAGQLHQDAAAIIAFVHDEIGFESYRGSLRGARGTLWSMAGNALDKSNLLIAMLRGAGVPARYEHGTLDQEPASTLIASMFESVRGGYGGYIPAGSALSDPANDDQLLLETQDHWWVQTFDGNTWHDVNPLLDDTPNWLAAVTNIQVPVNIVPFGEEHHITMRMRVESGSQLPTPGGGSLQTQTVLTHTWATAELVGRPVTLRHEVKESVNTGMVFFVRSLTYKPWFDDGGPGIPGDTYAELFSNFPFGNFYITGAWLDIDFTQPGGQQQTYTRELSDRVGIAPRTNGGSPQLNFGNIEPVFNSQDRYHILTEMSWQPDQFMRQLRNRVASFEGQVEPAYALYQTVLTSTIPAEVRSKNQTLSTIFQAQDSALRWAGHQLFWLSDGVPTYVTTAAAHVRIYDDQPRAVIISSDYRNGALRTAADLIANRQRHLAEPSQAKSVEDSTRWLKGAIDSALEGLIWPIDDPESALSVPRILQLAAAQHIELRTLTGIDSLAELASLDISAQAKARIFNTLVSGQEVVVPQHMVTLPQAISGTIPVTQTIGWWLIEPTDYTMIGVGETGLHPAMIEYSNLNFEKKASLLEALEERQAAEEAVRQFPQWIDRLTRAAATERQAIFEEFKQWVLQSFPGYEWGGNVGTSSPFLLLAERVSQKFINIIWILDYVAMNPELAPVPVDPPLSDVWLAQHIYVPDQYIPYMHGVVTTSATLATTPLISGTVFTQRVQVRDQAMIAVSDSQVLLITATAAKFSPTVQFEMSNTPLSFSAAEGTLNTDGQVLDVSQGLTLKGVNGYSDVWAHSAIQMRFNLSGNANRVLVAAIQPITLSVRGGITATAQLNIVSNIDDVYTVTVISPPGLLAHVSEDGRLQIIPSIYTKNGIYRIYARVTSQADPQVEFITQTSVVVDPPSPSFSISVEPDPTTSIPWNGAQIPNGAYTVGVTDLGTLNDLVTVTVTGFPSDWILISKPELDFSHTPYHETGLYVLPSTASGQVMPPPGTTYPFVVTASSSSGAVSQDQDTWIMPEVIYNELSTTPLERYAAPSSVITQSIQIANIGNVPSTFTLTSVLPDGWGGNVLPNITVGTQQTETVQLVVTVPNTATVGQRYHLSVESPTWGLYTSTTSLTVTIVSPCVMKVAQTARLAEQVAGSEGSLGLAAAWNNLTLQLSEFEVRLGDALWRARVMSATQSVIDHLSDTFPISIAGLQALVTDLGDNLTAADDTATLAAYCAPVTGVIDEIKRVTDRAASLGVQPGTATTLTDRPITYTVRLLNRGTLATTYNLAVDGLEPVWLSALAGSIALEPGQAGTWSFTATPNALGTYPFTVTVTAQEDSLVQYHSRVMLRVVDAFVKVLEVAAYPDFVDTGISHTNLSMQLANQAELSQPALAEVQVTAPDSTPVLTSSVPITLSPYDSQIRRIELGTLDTSGFITGVYTIGVTVTDLNGQFMPQGSGFGKFSVGQAISATARVTPQIVAPGNPVITTTIETYLPGSLRMNLNWTRSVETDTISAASIGNTADLSRALALPTYSNLVWDNGAIAPGNAHLVPPGHLWASWWQRYGIDMRHFRGTFTLPVGRNITTTDGILASPYYSPTMVPINDNVYIYLNGTRQFYGGTNYPGTPRGVVPETDYWYIPTGARLNGIREGENVIDIVTEERWGWGALGYLELTLLQPFGEAHYQVDTLHQIPVGGMQVLTETVLPPPEALEATAETNDYRWQHELSPTQRLQTMTFASQLLAMQPGEIRQVSADTIVSYTVASGSNQLHLGPLYVVAPHIIRLEPSSRIVASGGQATYAVMLFNPALYTDTFRLSVEGLPPEWINLPTEVTLGAGLSQTVMLTVQPAASTEESDWSFGVVADTGTGGRESVLAELSVRNALQVAVQPKQLAAGNSQTVTYTVSITNAEATFRTYSLTVAGLTENAVTLPATIGVAANTVMTVPLAVTAHAPRGWYPFEVQAAYATGNGVLSAADEAVLIVTSDLSVIATLSPMLGIGGPSVPVLYHLTVTNTGSLSDTYTFNVNLPTGWTYRLEANGSPVTTLSLTPYVFNAAELWLIVTPAPGTVPGAYDFTVHVQSQTEAQAQALVNGVLNVTERGVQVAISPEHTTMNPTDTRTWQVQVTNTGSVADTFNLMAGGIVSGSAQFAPASVSLAPGESQAVQLTSREMDFALPQTYPFAVTAQSASDVDIQNFDTAEITFSGYEAVQAELLPAAQTITDTLQATYLMVITNTGNIDTVYRLSANAPSLAAQWEVDEVYIPAHMTAGVLLTVYATRSGVYTINATARSLTSPAQNTASANLMVVFVNQPPIVTAGPDQTVSEGEWIHFNGSLTDPDASQPHLIEWDFGDGITTTGTLTPTHLYADNGIYLVTLTVTDNAGGVGQSTLHVTVNNATPQVNAGMNQTVLEGDTVLFNGTFTDLGALDTHTIQWNFGDGAIVSGVLTPTHVFADNGVNTATLTVIDKDGGSGMSTVLAMVDNVAPTADAGSDQTVARGQVAYFNGLFTDPGTADTHTITWNFGDGTTANGMLAPTHIYANSGVYTATLTVVDDDGGVGSDSLLVTVQAVVPAVNAGPDQSAAEGEAINFTAAVSGTGTLSGYTFVWSFGDGASASGTLTPTHTYVDNGVYTVTLNVTDDEDQVGSDTLLVTVTNVAPTVEAGPDESTMEGVAVSFNGAFTDPGVNDIHSIQWIFGDGLTASGALTTTHVYTRSGIYTVTLMVTDDDGGVGSDTLHVTVAAQPTACALYPIALHANTLLSATVGQTLPDIFNGAEQGNFGWLSWTGANGEPVLVNSLTPPGDSATYIDPNNAADHTVSITDWVSGRPGVANSRGVRDALDVLKTLTIAVPVWDTATGQGSNTQYHVVGFARIQITDYHLPGQDRIKAIYRGPATCQ